MATYYIISKALLILSGFPIMTKSYINIDFDKKEVKNTSWCIGAITFFIFLSHLFVLEKSRNGFLEYDLHFFIFSISFLFILGLYYLLKEKFSDQQGFIINFDKISISIFILVVYFTLQSIFYYGFSRSVALSWMILSVFFF